VAIGATCNVIPAPFAFGIGMVAGAVCVIGYAVVQPRLERALGIVDTCGVHNLHGMPGLLGGLAVVLVVPGVAGAQVAGIAVTMALALSGGVASGYLLRATGVKQFAYEDGEEFANMQEPSLAARG
jgi:ammonium transporter Rh